MRLRAGSGERGLAGMAAVHEVPGLRLLRPLLAVPKTRLLETLAAAGQLFLVDPTNTATRFARGRLRADPGFEPYGHWAESDAHTVLHGAGRTNRLAEALARLARSRTGWASCASTLVPGASPRPPCAPPAGPSACRRRRASLSGSRGRARPGGAARLRCTRHLGWLHHRAPRGRSSVCREPGRIRHRLSLTPGSDGPWDGRFVVRHEQGAVPVEVRPWGRQARGC